MKKIITVLMALLMVFGLLCFAGCKAEPTNNEPNIEIAVPETFPEGVYLEIEDLQGTNKGDRYDQEMDDNEGLLKVIFKNPKPDHAAYLIQCFDEQNKMVGVLELFYDEGFTASRTLPVGTYHIELSEYDRNPASVLDLVVDSGIEIKEGEVTEFVVEEVENEWDNKGWFRFEVDINSRVEKKYKVELVDENDMEFAHDFELTRDNSWTMETFLPIGTYTIPAIYEIKDDGSRGDTVKLKEVYVVNITSTEGTGIIAEFSNEGQRVIDKHEIESSSFTGEGVLSITINVPEGFWENILVQIYNRNTGEIIDFPVYAINDYIGRLPVPAGKYMVYSVTAGGDDPLNPKYQFEVGAKFEVIAEQGGFVTINPGGSSITSPDPGGMVTDTEIKPEDLMTDEEIETAKNAANN